MRLTLRSCGYHSSSRLSSAAAAQQGQGRVQQAVASKEVQEGSLARKAVLAELACQGPCSSAGARQRRRRWWAGPLPVSRNWPLGVKRTEPSAVCPESVRLAWQRPVAVCHTRLRQVDGASGGRVRAEVWVPRR